MNFSLTYIYEDQAFITHELENDHLLIEVKEIDNRITYVINPKAKITLKEASLEFDYKFNPKCSIFINGYQSWTYSRQYEMNEKVQGLEKCPRILQKHFYLRSYGDYNFVKYNRKNVHSVTYGYVRNDNHYDLIGSLNDTKAFLFIFYLRKENKIRLCSDIDNREIDSSFTLFDFVKYEGTKEETVDKYMSFFKALPAKKIRGYSSWYNDYQDINEAKIYKALEGIDSSNYDLFQIDDGSETFVGDWLDINKDKFPNGLKPIVDKIHSKGLKAGIWLAPIVAELKSRLYNEHKDWVAKDKNGNDIMGGCNWSGYVALDVNNPEVREYVKKSLQYYIDLGFDFFKLDFLYTAGLVQSKDKTRAENSREILEFIREVLKGKMILGCGVCLASAAGLVEYCRIGPDMGLSFDDIPLMRIIHRERVSTKSTIMNTIFRSHQDGHFFLNDPDVYLLRDDNMKLSKKQKEALLVMNHLFGSVLMTSDNVIDYDEEKKEMLANARPLLNAKVTNVIKVNEIIKISYLLDGEEKSIEYNWKKGFIK